MFITLVWVRSINLYYAFTLRPTLHNNGDIKKRYYLIADITMTHLSGLRPCNLLHPPRLRCFYLARLPAKKGLDKSDKKEIRVQLLSFWEYLFARERKEVSKHHCQFGLWWNWFTVARVQNLSYWGIFKTAATLCSSHILPKTIRLYKIEKPALLIRSFE